MNNNEQGLTLVELLGALAILSIIIVLIGSAHLFGQKQFALQTDEINIQGEVRDVISQITIDMRSVDAGDVFLAESQLVIGTNIYHYDKPTLLRNDELISNAINDLHFHLTEEGIEIEIVSTANKRGSHSSLETAIYFRR